MKKPYRSNYDVEQALDNIEGLMLILQRNLNNCGDSIFVPGCVKEFLENPCALHYIVEYMASDADFDALNTALVTCDVNMATLMQQVITKFFNCLDDYYVDVIVERIKASHEFDHIDAA